MDILERIEARYQSFSSTRKRISDFILSAPGQCCFLTLKRFAAQAGTTEATVLSFCRSLELDSYLDLKRALQDYVILRMNQEERMKLAVADSGSAQELHARVCRAEREALQSTLDDASLERLSAFTHRLGRAEKIFIAAHDFSRIPASYLSHRLVALGLDCSVLDLQARQEMFRRLSSVPPDRGLLIPIAIPPYSRDTISLARYCGEIGMPVAAVTDRPKSPVALLAQAVLLCHVEFMGMTNSFTAMFGLFDLLAMLCSFAGEPPQGPQGEEQAERSRAFHRCFEESAVWI